MEMKYWIYLYYDTPTSWLRCQYYQIVGVTEDYELAESIVNQYENIDYEDSVRGVESLHIIDQGSEEQASHMLTEYARDCWIEDEPYLVNGEVPDGWVKINDENPNHEYVGDMELELYNYKSRKFAITSKLEVNKRGYYDELVALIPDLNKCV